MPFELANPESDALSTGVAWTCPRVTGAFAPAFQLVMDGEQKGTGLGPHERRPSNDVGLPESCAVV